jgi:hypothetical protein
VVEDEGTLKALLFLGKAMCAMAKGGGEGGPISKILMEIKEDWATLI